VHYYLSHVPSNFCSRYFENSLESIPSQIGTMISYLCFLCSCNDCHMLPSPAKHETGSCAHLPKVYSNHWVLISPSLGAGTTVMSHCAQLWSWLVIKQSLAPPCSLLDILLLFCLSPWHDTVRRPSLDVASHICTFYTPESGIK
jgi:hypothetical protein